jgi:hypothetical protein
MKPKTECVFLRVIIFLLYILKLVALEAEYFLGLITTQNMVTGASLLLPTTTSYVLLVFITAPRTLDITRL